MEPASIRYKNPGAMWPGAIATKWGSTRFVSLNDGTGQGNKIAVFDTWVQGICAQLDLWRTSPKYRNKPFKDAIRVWSGGNNVASYIAYVKARVPGMTENTVMDDTFWRGPMAIPFLKAQSGHEAGKRIPAPDADWIEAQRRVMGGVAPVVVKPVVNVTPVDHAKVGGAVVAVTAAAGATAATNAGISAVEILAWIGGLSAVAIASFILGYRYFKGHWPWTGNQSQASSLPLLPQSGPSLEDLSQAQLALASAGLQAKPSPKSSVSNPRRKRSAKPSQKTRTRARKSSSSKATVARKSPRKRASKSKG